jgi:hypothetical protein
MQRRRFRPRQQSDNRVWGLLTRLNSSMSCSRRCWQVKKPLRIAIDVLSSKWKPCLLPRKSKFTGVIQRQMSICSNCSSASWQRLRITPQNCLTTHGDSRNRLAKNLFWSTTMQPRFGRRPPLRSSALSSASSCRLAQCWGRSSHKRSHRHPTMRE